MESEKSANTVRVTVVQAAPVPCDIPATIDKAERLIAEAAKKGSQLVLFPEVFVGGYHGKTYGSEFSPQTEEGKELFRKYSAGAITVPGPEVDRFATMAAKHKVFVVMGAMEKEGYTLYCTQLFFSPQGKYMGKHRNLMPTGEERVVWGFGDGSTMPVFDTPIGKIGALICWENKMPLARTAMYYKGIQIYCAPTTDDSDTWKHNMVHIADEGGCYVLSACQYLLRKDYPPSPEYTFPNESELNPDSVVLRGGSLIVTPSREIIAGPNFEGETSITADLDLHDIAREKLAFDAVGHYARPDVFGLIVRDDPQDGVTFSSTAPLTTPY